VDLLEERAIVAAIDRDMPEFRAEIRYRVDAGDCDRFRNIDATAVAAWGGEVVESEH
jgi:hypothetical protein